MMVETFLDIEKISTAPDDVETYNQTVLDLGLENLCYKEQEVNITPMNKMEIGVYRTLCPKTVALKDYKHHIPLRVIEAYKACKDFLEDLAEQDNERLLFEVWVDEKPDPVLIAKIGWSDYYLIGRWGHELETFNTLLKRAKEKAMAELSPKIKEMQSMVERFESNPDEIAMKKVTDSLGSIYL